MTVFSHDFFVFIHLLSWDSRAACPHCGHQSSQMTSRQHTTPRRRAPPFTPLPSRDPHTSTGWPSASLVAPRSARRPRPPPRHRRRSRVYLHHRHRARHLRSSLRLSSAPLRARGRLDRASRCHRGRACRRPPGPCAGRPPPPGPPPHLDEHSLLSLLSEQRRGIYRVDGRRCGQ